MDDELLQGDNFSGAVKAEESKGADSNANTNAAAPHISQFATSQLSQVSHDSFKSSLLRMTTSRRIFQNHSMDISKSTFRNLFNSVKEERDLSQDTMLRLWDQRVRNKKLRPGESLDVSAVIVIEDCYEIESAADLGEDHDMVEHQLVVFDSKKDPEDGGKTIKEVLAAYPSIL